MQKYRHQPHKLGRKGQQALEYLITYGWAFVVILLTISAFAYFGLLNPIRYLPEKCDFGVQMVCSDFILENSADQGYVKIRVQNAYGHDISIHDFSTANGGGTFFYENDPSGQELDTPPANGVVVKDGEKSPALVLDLKGSSNTLVEGEKMSVPLMLNFSRCDTPPDDCSLPADKPYHIVQGEIFSGVQ